MTIAEFPECMQVLFDPEPRFIALWGGRGSGKSWSVARALLIRAAQSKLRILCAREYQNSIAESVHKLLSLQIEALGLDDFYEIQNTTIIGKNGSEFIFTGLKNNASKLKSYESLNIVWCEESQTISKNSWEILTPTIRLPGSQIILTFNPLLEDDFIYQRFIAHPPANAVVVRVNYTENPYFGEPLLSEMLAMKAEDPDGFANVWLGHPRRTLDGAIYAAELRAAEIEGRITKVPYDRAKPISTFWDLGYSDNTSIWFVQIIGFEFHVIDFHSDRQKSIEHYQKVLQEKGYLYDTHWLPHDAAHKQLAAGGRSIETQMRSAGHTVRIVPSIRIADGINAARTIFPNCWFDADKCADGLQDLRHYRYDVDPDTGQFSRAPLHDQHSHSADAWRMCAIALKEPKKIVTKVVKPVFRASANGWMG